MTVLYRVMAAGARPTGVHRGPGRLRQLLTRWMPQRRPAVEDFLFGPTRRPTAADIDNALDIMATTMTRLSEQQRQAAAELADTADGLADAEAIAVYEERVRRERYIGRMYVLGLADDAWARYGWIRPKIAVRR